MEISINKDKDFVKKMREKIKENSGHCPCKLEKTEDTRCMCKEFLEQQEDGWCHCGLYYKKI